MTAVLERRIEDGVVRTRPLCPYPQVARYRGTGSTDEAANFTCKAPIAASGTSLSSPVARDYLLSHVTALGVRT
jgi:hypothetical protein